MPIRWTSNVLLASMLPADFDKITTHACEIELIQNVELLKLGEELRYCYFPLSGMISAVAADLDGEQAQIALIGVEGVCEVGTLLGDEISATHLFVEVPGRALRVPASDLRSASEQSSALAKLMLAYARTYQIQIGASALASTNYRLEKRLARWLLMLADRSGQTSLPITHKALSMMLGVRRAGVTVALGELCESGMITTGRNSITISDRKRLGVVAGAGYGAAEVVYQRLIGRHRPPAPDAQPSQPLAG